MSRGKLEPDQVLRRKPGLSATEMAGRTVMLDVGSGSYFALDEVGGAVWEALARPTAVREVIAYIDASFEAPDTAAVARDVTDFLAELLAQGLVERIAEQ